MALFACDLPQEPFGGCEPVEASSAVDEMLQHLENTFEFVSGWDGVHEDYYWEGEMTSWRRIQHPVVGRVDFKLVDDNGASCCAIWLGEGHVIVYTVEEYMAVIESFERVGGFSEWFKKWNVRRHG